MKAAVIYQRGDMPQYVDVAEPQPQSEDKMLMTVKAAAIKHLDKSIASGKHFSAKEKKQARIIGGDGVGILEDGTLVYALGVSGTIAEKAVVEKSRMIPLPEGISDAVAAAIPNAVAGSAMALRFRAGLQKGETVLINGATGFTGKMAVQIAKQYGAGKIIVTGRNEKTLQQLRTLGAEEIISLKQSDDSFASQIKETHNHTPIDVVIDYLWGHTAELILSALQGKGSYQHKTRFVSVGAITGDGICLSSEVLRSTDIQISGSGLGSWTNDEMKILFTEIIPQVFIFAVEGKITTDIMEVKLADIESLWEKEVPDGRRLVVIV